MVPLLSWQTDALHCLEFARMTSIRSRTGMHRRPLMMTTVTVMMMMMIVKMMVLRKLVHMSMKRKFLCHTVAVHGLTFFPDFPASAFC